jgi:phosphate transport system substrate-binding protein
MIRSKSKFWSLLLVMVLVLAACGGGSDDAAEEAEESGGEESVTQTTAASSSSGSSSSDSGLTGEILIDGSSTVFPITQAVAEEFTAVNPGVQISVGVSGTGGGFKKFCPGETDISDASRPIKAKERDLCAENGTTFTELQVGVDALSVVVPTSNDWATCLTTEELGAIWGADSTVSNWNQVRSSFPDVAIDLYGPGTDSGTFDFFNEEITEDLGGSRSDYTASEDDNVLVNGVSGSAGGLGYFGLAYYEENKDKLTAVQVDAGDGCQPPEAAFEGNYFLARPLFIYIAESAKGMSAVREFVDFYFVAMDAIVPAVGYVPMLAEQKMASLMSWSAFSRG